MKANAVINLNLVGAELHLLGLAHGQVSPSVGEERQGVQTADGGTGELQLSLRTAKKHSAYIHYMRTDHGTVIITMDNCA